MAPLEMRRPRYRRPVDSGVMGTPSGRHRLRPGRAGILAVLAVAALGVAGMAAYTYVRYQRMLSHINAESSSGDASKPGSNAPAANPAAARAAGRKVSEAPDKAETRTRLVVLRAGKEGEPGR